MMEKVWISDKTLKQAGRRMPLSFREKIELSRLIDRLEVDTLELPAIENQKVDSLLIKSIAAAVKRAEIAVPVHLNPESVEQTWKTLQEAKKARLQVSVPVSSVQMEYLFHLKPAVLSRKVEETVRECRKYTDRVELIAEDAFRGDRSFLIPLVQKAIDAGANHITFQEAAGVSLPEELRAELDQILEEVDRRDGVTYGIDCSDELSLADACAVETVRCGIRELKAATFPLSCASLANVVRILALKGEKLGVSCHIRREELRRVTTLIENLCRTHVISQNASAEDDGDQSVALSRHDSRESICRAMEQLGYLLLGKLREQKLKRLCVPLAHIRKIFQRLGRHLDIQRVAAAMFELDKTLCFQRSRQLFDILPRAAHQIADAGERSRLGTACRHHQQKPLLHCNFSLNFLTRGLHSVLHYEDT